MEIAEKQADPLDAAKLMMDQVNGLRIDGIRAQAAQISTKNATSECWYCGEETGHSARWCSIECRNNWDHEQKLIRMRP